jgi:hypothetical protein
MRVAITGASGFIGSAAVADLHARGHEPAPLVRTVTGAATAPGAIPWNPATGTIGAAGDEPFDAVLHLAGENVAARRWTAAQKQRLRESRGPLTERLCQRLAARPASLRPKVLIAASATGVYGDRGDEMLDEASAPGTGFLATVATEWEAATRPAADAGIRVINLRIGMVLGRGGGALQKLLPPFRLCLGGRLGSGRQWLGWIALPDLLAAVDFALRTPALHGPVLATAPAAVTNREFTRVLAAVLRRPAIAPAPAFALRLLLGEMADALLLASQRTQPTRLPAAGFAFAFPTLESTLRAAIGPPPPDA